MSERKKLGYRISAVFMALALIGLAFAAGCGGGGGEAERTYPGGYRPPPVRTTPWSQSGAPAAAGPVAAAPAGLAAGAPLAGAPGALGAPAAAAVPAAPSGPALPTEEEKTERLAAFASKYGPVTQTKVKDWDGREIEFVTFTYKGQKIGLPLSMVWEAAKPEELEGYFKTYPASAISVKAVSAKQVSTTAGSDQAEATAEESSADDEAPAEGSTVPAA